MSKSRTSVCPRIFHLIFWGSWAASRETKSDLQIIISVFNKRNWSIWIAHYRKIKNIKKWNRKKDRQKLTRLTLSSIFNRAVFNASISSNWLRGNLTSFPTFWVSRVENVCSTFEISRFCVIKSLRRAFVTIVWRNISYFLHSPLSVHMSFSTTAQGIWLATEASVLTDKMVVSFSFLTLFPCKGGPWRVLDLLLGPGCTWAGELLPSLGVLGIVVIDLMVSLLRPCDGISDELLWFHLLLGIAAVDGMDLFTAVGNRVLPDVFFLELDFLEMLGELVKNEAEKRVDCDISRMLWDELAWSKINYKSIACLIKC